MSTPVRRARYPFEIRLANGILRREPRPGGSHSTGEQTGAGSQPPSQTSARTTRPGTRTRVDDPPAEVGWHAGRRHVVTAPLDFEIRGGLHERFASARSAFVDAHATQLTCGSTPTRAHRDGRWRCARRAEKASSVRAPASRTGLPTVTLARPQRTTRQERAGSSMTYNRGEWMSVRTRPTASPPTRAPGARSGLAGPYRGPHSESFIS
jgi:hypothetical protein